MRIAIILLLLVIILKIEAYGQTGDTKKADSLRIRLTNAVPEEQADILNLLSEAFYNGTEYDSALYYAGKAHEQALSAGYTAGQADALRNAAETYDNRKQYDQSIAHYEEAVSLYNRIGQSDKLTYCNRRLGVVYRKSLNYTRALGYLFKSLSLAETHNLPKDVSAANFQIGFLYHMIAEYNNAIDYYNRSVRIDESLRDTLGAAMGLCNIGICYTDKKDTATSLAYYQKSHTYYSAVQDTEGIALTLNNIGMLYLRTRRYREALDHLLRAHDLFERRHDTEGRAYALNGIGDVYFRTGDAARGLTSQLDALRLTGEIDLRKSIYESLATIYAATGDYASAYRYHLLYAGIKDTILNRDNSQHIAEIQTRYETEKKEQEIALLQLINMRQRDNLAWMSAGLAVLLASVLLIYSNRRNIQQSRKRLRQVNECLLSFGNSPDENIQKIIRLFGELTQADRTAYYRQTDAGIEEAAAWNDPVISAAAAFPVVTAASDEMLECPADSVYIGKCTLPSTGAPADTQPPVSGLFLCYGKPVRFHEANRGVLCAVFRKRFKPTKEINKLTGILAAAIGIEEERRAAIVALGHSEKRYRELFDNSLGYIGIHDMAGTLLMANPAAATALGYSREEITGRPVSDLLMPGTRRFFGKYLQAIQQEKKASGVMRVRARSGETRIWIFHNVKYEDPGRQPFVLGHALDITGLEAGRKEREKLIHDLQHALAKVKTLSGLLPICSGCKKIRDDGGYWNQIENYISDHSEAEFSHGMCPDCQRKFYPELFKDD